jgi:hypothetical protein
LQLTPTHAWQVFDDELMRMPDPAAAARGRP